MKPKIKNYYNKNEIELADIARKLRALAIKSVHSAGSGHLGGSLSAADIISCLYFDEMNLNPSKPMDRKRDRFILSKGHSCPILYSALAHKGFFNREELLGLRHINRLLQGHPDIKIPGVEFPSGSLGNGLPAAIGMAQESKEKKLFFRTYVLLGDGDMQEGSTDEALRILGFIKYSNVAAILDANKRQGDDKVENVLNYLPKLASRIRSYGWLCLEINGHHIGQILKAFKTAREEHDKPTFIIAHTVKGKGV